VAHPLVEESITDRFMAAPGVLTSALSAVEAPRRCRRVAADGRRAAGAAGPLQAGGRVRCRSAAISRLTGARLCR